MHRPLGPVPSRSDSSIAGAPSPASWRANPSCICATSIPRSSSAGMPWAPPMAACSSQNSGSGDDEWWEMVCNVR